MECMPRSGNSSRLHVKSQRPALLYLSPLITDFASELIAAEQAKLAAKANLRVLSVQADLEHATVNVFA